MHMQRRLRLRCCALRCCILWPGCSKRWMQSCCMLRWAQTEVASLINAAAVV
jgi:hypothetical protein